MLAISGMYGFNQGDGSKFYGDVVTKGVRAWYVRKGQAHESATVYTGLANGSVTNLAVQNPAESGKQAVLQGVKFSSTGQATIRIYNGSTLTENSGTILDVENRKTDADTATVSPDDEVLVVESQPTVSVNDPNPADALVLGSTGGRGSGSAGESGGTVLPPGTNRHYQITSGADQNTVAVSLVWHELPRDEDL